jgi:hypothetical protein
MYIEFNLQSVSEDEVSDLVCKRHAIQVQGVEAVGRRHVVRRFHAPDRMDHPADMVVHLV